ncbi:hypothetical protein IB213_14440 [Comamonas sp. CMM02]|nr:hypothetical protein [Comamonas sp. CMM02]
MHAWQQLLRYQLDHACHDFLMYGFLGRKKTDGAGTHQCLVHRGEHKSEKVAVGRRGRHRMSRSECVLARVSANVYFWKAPAIFVVKNMAISTGNLFAFSKLERF